MGQSTHEATRWVRVHMRLRDGSEYTCGTRWVRVQDGVDRRSSQVNSPAATAERVQYGTPAPEMRGCQISMRGVNPII